jgi:formate hydrogenlyase transcriptional activator
MSAPEKVPEPRKIPPSTNRAQILLEINNAIVTHLELAPLLRAISECLRRELPHDFAGLAIYDPEIRQLRIHALNFEAGQESFSVGQIVPIEGTPGGLAFTSRRPVLRHRPDPNEFPAERMKEAMQIGVKSGCVVPLICHGNALGTLAIASLRESAFTEADAELLSQIAAQVAIAVGVGCPMTRRSPLRSMSRSEPRMYFEKLPPPLERNTLERTASPGRFCTP